MANLLILLSQHRGRRGGSVDEFNVETVRSPLSSRIKSCTYTPIMTPRPNSGTRGQNPGVADPPSVSVLCLLFVLEDAFAFVWTNRQRRHKQDKQDTTETQSTGERRSVGSSVHQSVFERTGPSSDSLSSRGK